MTVARTDAAEAAYRAFAGDLAKRARKLPREVVSERVETAFRELCVSVRPTVSLEVGAHEAGFSRWLKAEVPDARCVAFEANPYVHRKFAADLAAADVEYHHLAVSDVAGSVDLRIPRRLHNTKRDRWFRKQRTSRMASLADHRWAVRTESVAVPSVPLDDFIRVQDHDAVVAWIDVEGSSRQVLSSGREVLSRAELVYIEVEKEQVWDGQWLDTDVAAFFADSGLVPVLRDIQRRHQYNVVFAAADLANDPLVTRLRDDVYRP